MSENVEDYEKHTKTGRIQKVLEENRANVRVSATLTVVSTKDFNDMVVIPDAKHKFIRTRNTDNLFKVDPEDFEHAKYLRWSEPFPGQLVNDKGDTFEEYVGIVGARLYPFNPRDKRREHYHGC